MVDPGSHSGRRLIRSSPPLLTGNWMVGIHVSNVINKTLQLFITISVAEPEPILRLWLRLLFIYHRLEEILFLKNPGCWRRFLWIVTILILLLVKISRAEAGAGAKSDLRLLGAGAGAEENIFGTAALIKIQAADVASKPMLRIWIRSDRQHFARSGSRSASQACHTFYHRMSICCLNY